MVPKVFEPLKFDRITDKSYKESKLSSKVILVSVRKKMHHLFALKYHILVSVHKKMHHTFALKYRLTIQPLSKLFLNAKSFKQ